MAHEDASTLAPTSSSASTSSISDVDSPPSSLPPPRDQEAESIILKILDIHDRMSQISNFTPCDRINGLFGELMAICLIPYPASRVDLIMADERVREILPSLHRLCNESEIELEKYWSERIAMSSNPQQELHSFPYYKNYTDLTRLELASLYAIEPSLPKNIAFIGSGPLPLTSLCLIEQLTQSAKLQKLTFMNWARSWFQKEKGVVVMNIDHDPQAITASRKLCESLGKRAKGMEFFLGEASNETTPVTSFSNPYQKATPSDDLRKYDVVFLAALVGATQDEKERLLRDVVGRMKVGALVVVRSVQGLRGLCYPVFDATREGVGGEKGVLELGCEVHPLTEVVNSVIVGKARVRK